MRYLAIAALLWWILPGWVVFIVLAFVFMHVMKNQPTPKRRR
jgi:hypothetical protein